MRRHQLAQAFAIFVRGPKARRDISEAPVVIEERDSFLDEGKIEIEIAGLCTQLRLHSDLGPTVAQELRHVSVDGSKILELDVGWIANHRVEAAAGEHGWKNCSPVKGVHALYLHIVIEHKVDLAFVEITANQAVTFADVLVEGGKRLVATCGVEPEREPGDFHRGRVNIDAINI